MADTYEIEIRGLPGLQSLNDAPEKIMQAISRAVNATTRTGRSRAAKAIRAQVNFPARYLSPSEGKLTVAQFASPANPEGRIRARSRGTSLARFATGPLQPGKRGGITVSVKPGSVRFMRKAFPIKLKRGNSDDPSLFNMGLAIRLKAGETIANKRQMIRLSSGRKSSVYLLYGPSVDQVFKTVRTDLVPELEAYLADEFSRLVDL